MANGFPPKKSKCIGMIGGGGHTIHHRALGTMPKHDDGKSESSRFFVVLLNVAARFSPLAISVAAAQTLHDKPAWRCAALGAIFRCG